MSSILFVGGCRSGKSGLAQRWAEKTAPRRVFIATARAVDAEMQARIARHRAGRGPGWSCVEEAVKLVPVMQDLASEPVADKALLLDCVSFWLCNLMELGLADKDIADKVEELGRWLAVAPLPVAVVTHESGCGVAPASTLGNHFRDLNGEANQILARHCPCVILVSCGLPLMLKGSAQL